MRVREIPEGYYQSRAFVFCGEEYAGTLERTREGAVFAYDDAYLDRPEKLAPSIASSMPRSRKEHKTSGVNLHPFFANLLPEGWVLQAVAARTKVARDDLLSILVAIGRDTIGDVWLDWSREPEVPLKKEWDLRTATFEEILSEQYGVSSKRLEAVSIPGFQEKISANRITITQVRAKGHPAIIKLNLNPDKYPMLVQNEMFFMEMARTCGIPVPKVKIIFDAAGSAGLWVERFDREMTPDGTAKRLHQEDICQILELYPGDKYNVSARDAVNALQEVCPAWKADALHFLRLYAFSYIIGNGDLHGKNISVLARKGGIWSLSPGYDLLTTVPYKDRSMAIHLLGRKANIRGRDLVKFGALFEIPEPAIRDMLAKLTAKAVPFVAQVDSIGFDKKSGEFLAKDMGTRLATLGEY